jgi:hypothetical protein
MAGRQKGNGRPEKGRVPVSIACPTPTRPPPLCCFCESAAPPGKTAARVETRDFFLRSLPPRPRPRPRRRRVAFSGNGSQSRTPRQANKWHCATGKSGAHGRPPLSRFPVVFWPSSQQLRMLPPLSQRAKGKGV